MRILIADDEKDFTVLLAERLILKGHAVDTANDGMSAMNLIKMNRYDIAFVDHNMPERTGLELITDIKEREPHCNVIMITGYPEMDRALALAYGVDGYLTKPIDLKIIDDIIEKYK